MIVVRQCGNITDNTQVAGRYSTRAISTAHPEQCVVPLLIDKPTCKLVDKKLTCPVVSSHSLLTPVKTLAP